MTDRKFNEYWWVHLQRNPEWNKEDEKHDALMKGHFTFIEDQSDKGNLFAAIPMAPNGGQYWLDGELSEDEVKEIIANEPSIGTVFKQETKRAYVSEYLLNFTMENKKRIDQQRVKSKE